MKNEQVSAREPWRGLPVEVADVIEPELSAITSEIFAALPREVPEYARPLEGAFGRGLRAGVTEALRQFVALIRDPDSGRGQGRDLYVNLGRGELRQGRSLDSLQSAYRVGARVAWRHLGEKGVEAGLEAPVLNLLAESIFAYIDGLSAESVEGYAAASAAREGERERRRTHLLAQLIARPPLSEEAIESLAREAEWPVPRRAAALACAPADLGRLGRRLPAQSLAATLEELGCAVVPDPDGPGRAKELEAAAREIVVAVGPAAPPGELGRSWATATRLLGAIERGEVDAAGAVRADEHLMALALAEGREPLDRIGALRMRPFADLTPRARKRMAETLFAFLRLQGGVAAMAEELHVHQQTVRYRMARLRELLGDDLEDPDARFELEAVLRAGLGLSSAAGS